MEEATFFTKYGSIVYIIHRRDTFRASKIMQQRVLTNPKIQVLWNLVVVGAYGDENTNNRVLGGLKMKKVSSGEVSDLKVWGLFFAIGHEPTTKFLDGQMELDSGGYVVTKPGTTQTSVSGVFAAGDVQDKKYRQAVTAAGTGLSISSISPLHHLNFDFGASMFAALLFFILFGIICCVWVIRCICFCFCFLLGQNYVYRIDIMLNLIAWFTSLLCTAYSDAFFNYKLLVYMFLCS